MNSGTTTTSAAVNVEDASLDTRDQRFKQLLERHLGKNGISILVFHTFLLVFAVLLIMFLNISFTKTRINEGATGGLGSREVAQRLLARPAIMSV